MVPGRSATPTPYAVLLRAVNVGGRSLSMAALRDLCADAGCTGVRTYLQSGNAVLESALGPVELVAELEHRIAEHAGFDVSVVARTAAELAGVVERCPFDTSVDPTRLVVSFVQDLPAEPLRGIDPDAFGVERLALDGRELYLWLPDGQGRSRLAQAVARTPFGKVATARNWRTVVALRELAEAGDP